MKINIIIYAKLAIIASTNSGIIKIRKADQ